MRGLNREKREERQRGIIDISVTDQAGMAPRNENELKKLVAMFRFPSSGRGHLRKSKKARSRNPRGHHFMLTSTLLSLSLLPPSICEMVMKMRVAVPTAAANFFERVSPSLFKRNSFQFPLLLRNETAERERERETATNNEIEMPLPPPQPPLK